MAQKLPLYEKHYSMIVFSGIERTFGLEKSGSSYPVPIRD